MGKRIERNEEEIKSMTQWLEEGGCSDELLSRTLIDGLKAERVYVNGFGDTVREVDWDVRLKYLTLALGIKNHRTKAVDDSNSDRVITLQIVRADRGTVIDVTGENRRIVDGVVMSYCRGR